MWWCGNGWYMGWWGPILGLLWFVLLGLFVYWLVRALAPEGYSRHGQDFTDPRRAARSREGFAPSPLQA